MTTLGDWLSREPFTLAMSSGFFGFYAHAGVVRALDDAGLAPARATGSSAGAMVAGLWAAGLSGREICAELRAVTREQFWDPGPGLGLLRGRKFHRHLTEVIGEPDMAACRIPVALSVFDIAAVSTAVLDDGDLASAVVASCALPLLFQPIRRGRRLYSDGGILDRPGLHAAKPGERILHHHLVSRSPWRRKDSPALRPPRRDNLVSLLLPDLPRSGPFKLELGHRAMEIAHRRAASALEQSIDADTVIA